MDTDQAGRPSATPLPSSAGHADTPAVVIRPIASLQEFRACVDLQAEVWGADFTDFVPATLLQVARHVGGVVLGAFTGPNELVGFLFGLTGVHHGQLTHWSHLLGVRDSARNLGVGRQLKEAQRVELAALGVPRMSWTFDPLVAKNAHLNLNRLGARVVEYMPDMYGTTTSPLHFGLATDRLVVSCETHPDTTALESSAPTAHGVPILTCYPQDGDLLVDTAVRPDTLWIEIPSDIRQVIEQTPAAALVWRQAVREHFQWGLSHGYEVTGVHRDPVTSRSFYILRTTEAA